MQGNFSTPIRPHSSNVKGKCTPECLLPACVYMLHILLMVNQNISGIEEIKNLGRKYLSDITIN